MAQTKRQGNMEDKAIAQILVGCKPMAFKRYPDGSMNVINSIGQKFHFTAAQVGAALVAATKLVSAPKPKPKASNK